MDLAGDVWQRCLTVAIMRLAIWRRTMTTDTRAWNDPVEVTVTHDHLNRALSALGGNDFDFEDIVMAGNAIAILDTLRNRFTEHGDPTGGAEAAVGGYLRHWAIHECGLVDPEVEKARKERENGRRDREARSAKLRIEREAKQRAKFEAAVAKQIVNMGHSAQIAAE
jgi:hypothetical protein